MITALHKRALPSFIDLEQRTIELLEAEGVDLCHFSMEGTHFFPALLNASCHENGNS